MAGQDAWQMAARAFGYTLTLPPQTIAEAMHKRAGEKDIAPGMAVDFRFSPVAVLDLNSSIARQNFVEAPWNLRRVLGYAGQDASTPPPRPTPT